ncbi:Panacea domain-containing protein [Cylindrospermum sp. FACHB-282]|uniref:Panacea domain-containing protein n=1 Tax=Cylindrospermum sp. FACHB-282 TaxID=2692794 RepID=UPI0028164F6E|nr:type II toxin-antitoxin system antitoxin SocA domain-containing protein [Cylindrospermum sp. FACHB-282]
MAKYFLAQTDEDAGDLISNLKLQKLLYYAQGFHLALYDKPLFSEPIEAWRYGPVVPEVYHEYKNCGSDAIPIPEDIDFSKFNEQTVELLNEVYNVYGQFSAWKLRNMTHNEDPWKDTSVGDVIIFQSLKKYFKTQLVNEDE